MNGRMVTSTIAGFGVEAVIVGKILHQQKIPTSTIFSNVISMAIIGLILLVFLSY
jgi:uncharacterized protein related to proFAR isomerase